MGILCKLTFQRLCPWGQWRVIEAEVLDGETQRTVTLERRTCSKCGKSEER